MSNDNKQGIDPAVIVAGIQAVTQLATIFMAIRAARQVSQELTSEEEKAWDTHVRTLMDGLQWVPSSQPQANPRNL